MFDSFVSQLFSGKDTLKEIMLFKGSRLVTVTRQQAEQKNFKAMFKKIWLQNK
jgi:hypothetical protein